jgi:hypothetical protein
MGHEHYFKKPRQSWVAHEFMQHTTVGSNELSKATIDYAMMFNVGGGNLDAYS